MSRLRSWVLGAGLAAIGAGACTESIPPQIPDSSAPVQFFDAAVQDAGVQDAGDAGDSGNAHDAADGDA